MSNDWIEHNGGPQPVDGETWVEILVDGPYGMNTHQVRESAYVRWAQVNLRRTLNQHLIDAARLEGIRLGLEAAAKVAAEKVEKRIGVPCPDGIKGCLAFHFRREYHDKSAFVITQEIRAINPETIARDRLTKPAPSDLPPSSSDTIAQEAHND